MYKCRNLQRHTNAYEKISKRVEKRALRKHHLPCKLNEDNPLVNRLSTMAQQLLNKVALIGHDLHNKIFKTVKDACLIWFNEADSWKSEGKFDAKMCKAVPKQLYNCEDDDIENAELIIISFDEDEPISNDNIEVLTNRADLMHKREEQRERSDIMKDDDRKLEKVEEEKIEKKTEPESKAKDGKKTSTKLLVTKRNYEATNRLKLMKTTDAKFKIERIGSMGRAEHSHLTLKESLNNAEQQKSRKLKRKRQTLD
uniref:Uncharacterized protein n=1 Tax=Glossina austeni TaxID=7395 RepID=A0A1A9VUL8_GLOAU